MAIKLFVLLFIAHNLYCVLAAAHVHSVDNIERESDGSYKPRDQDHYGDSGHNTEFDHEAILGARCFTTSFVFTTLRRRRRLYYCVIRKTKKVAYDVRNTLFDIISAFYLGYNILFLYR